MQISESSRSTLCGDLLACVASVSVGFGSKERPRNGMFGVFSARKMGREPKKRKRGVWDGNEGNACRQTPEFWKPPFACERSSLLAGLVEFYLHVSIKGLELLLGKEGWCSFHVFSHNGACCKRHTMFNLTLDCRPSVKMQTEGKMQIVLPCVNSKQTNLIQAKRSESLHPGWTWIALGLDWIRVSWEGSRGIWLVRSHPLI